MERRGRGDAEDVEMSSRRAGRLVVRSDVVQSEKKKKRKPRDEF